MIHRFVQVGLVIGILVAGALGSMAFVNMKSPPKQKEVEEQVLRVEAIEVSPRNVEVVITGHAEAKARDVVNIIPEVAGNVIEIHDRLDVGETIAAGELLFKIDPRNYQAMYDQAQAQVTRSEQAIALLETQFRTDRERLNTVERSATLAGGEFERLKTLYEQEEVGTLANVERAEMSFNQATDMRDQMSQAVTLYPVRIQEAQGSLDAARAQADLARANLERCEVRAPFDARITMARVETGQYVAPGAQPVLSLANDSLIQLSVPLDSRDVSAWLRFDDAELETSNSWFGALEQVPCTIHWTEGEGHAWQGIVHRVEAFDPRSRTVTVNVQVASNDASGAINQLPLVDGMFCRVLIPGHTMNNVYQLPDWAVDFNGYAYLSVDSRLEKRLVSVVRGQENFVYVDEGLNPGEHVIVTRLVNPLPNSLLQVTMLNEDGTPRDAPSQGASPNASAALDAADSAS